MKTWSWRLRSHPLSSCLWAVLKGLIRCKIKALGGLTDVSLSQVFIFIQVLALILFYFSLCIPATDPGTGTGCTVGFLKGKAWHWCTILSTSKFDVFIIYLTLLWLGKKILVFTNFNNFTSQHLIYWYYYYLPIFINHLNMLESYFLYLSGSWRNIHII